MTSLSTSMTRALRGYHAGYLFALTLVGGFSLGAFVTSGDVIHEQESAGHVINMAGRQRMLSQRIALLSLTAPESEAYDQAITLMMASNSELLSLSQGGGVLHLLSPQATAFAGQLKVEVGNYITAARHHAPDLPSRADALLPRLDRFVADLETGAKAELERLSRVEYRLLLATLALLLMEALFLFRPLTRRLGRALKTTEKARLRAENRRRLTAQILDQMQDAIVLVDPQGRLTEEMSRPFAALFPEARPGAPLGEVMNIDDRPLSEQLGRQNLERGLQVLELKIEPFAGEPNEHFIVYVRDTTDAREQAHRRAEEAEAIRSILGDDPDVARVAFEELQALVQEARDADAPVRVPCLDKLEKTAASLGFEELATSAQRARRLTDDDEAYRIALEGISELKALFPALAAGRAGPIPLG